MSESIVKVTNLSVAYTEDPVLWNVSFQLPVNSMTAVIGPNGAGKSTLIKTMLGMQKKLAGNVQLFDQSYQAVYKRIAYVPQIGNVEWDFPTTVTDVVLMGRYSRKGRFRSYGKADHIAVAEALEKVAMADFAHRQISELSGGQRQRVFLARAIAQDADFYLLDEPLQGVDKKTEDMIITVLKDFQRQGKTILVVHHDLATVKAYFDHAILLNKGLVSAGPLAEAFTKTAISQAYESGIGENYGY